MTATVRLFAGAGEAVGRESVAVEPGLLPEVLSAVTRQAPDVDKAERVLAQCSVLVDGRRPTGPVTVQPGQVVDVLPPFCGG